MRDIDPREGQSWGERLLAIVAVLSIVALILMVAYSFAVARSLPDPELTPGACKAMSVEQLCSTKWGKDKRHVTAAMKREVFKSYGLTGNHDPSCKCKRHFEIDHLCSRELGGEDVVANLWAQCYCGKWNAVMKDRLENRLHKEICAGNITPEEAQAAITSDWRNAYRRYFGR